MSPHSPMATLGNSNNFIYSSSSIELATAQQLFYHKSLNRVIYFSHALYRCEYSDVWIYTKIKPLLCLSVFKDTKYPCFSRRKILSKTK